MTTQAKVTITAENRLAAGLRAAQADLQSFSAGAQRLLKGAFVGISVAAIAQAGNRLLELGDQLNKGAIKSGIAAEAFSQLSYAARLAGVDTGALSSSLSKMQKGLSEAASGAAAPNEALAALGLSIAEIIKLAPDQQFEILGDRINQLKDPADRARAAIEIFGKAGADLLPLFEQGAEGIRKAREEAEKIGQSFSKEQLQKLTDAKDAVDRLKESFDALGIVLAAGVSDKLKQFFDTLTAYATDDKSFKLTARIRQIQIEIDSPTIAEYRKKQLREEQAKLQKELDALNLGEVSVTAKKIGGAPPGFRPPPPKAGAAPRPEKGKYVDPFALPTGGLNTIDASMLEATRFDQFGKELKDILEQSTQETADRMKELFSEPFDELSVYAEQAARNMQDAFANFLFDPFKGGLQGMLQSFEQTIRQMVAQAVAADLFKRLGNWAAGAAGSGGVMGAIGSIVKVMLPPGKAAGGPVMGGSPYLVGEKGPELFVPRLSGAIIPNLALAGLGRRGMTVVNNFSIAAPAGTIDRRTQMQLAAQVRLSVARGGRNT